MKEILVKYLKYNKIIYLTYYNVFNSIIKVYGAFLKSKPNLILFSSYGGKKYDDSPKAIFEKMRKDPRFSDCEIVWAFHNPENLA